MPEISIITPCLRAAEVIGDCAQSVVEQSHEAEHLVVTGDAEQDIATLKERLSPGVRVIRETPRGIYAALNTGIREAKSEVIGALHADDFFHSGDVLATVAEAFEDPSIDACYGDLCYVDQEDIRRVVRYWTAGAFKPSSFRNGWMPPHPTFFLRRSMYEKHGMYREDLGTAADYELMLRMLYRHRLKAVYIPSVLVNMRTGGASNASLAARLAASHMDRRAWKVNDLSPYPWFSVAKPARKISQWWRRPATS